MLGKMNMGQMFRKEPYKSVSRGGMVQSDIRGRLTHRPFLKK